MNILRKKVSKILSRTVIMRTSMNRVNSCHGMIRSSLQCVVHFLFLVKLKILCLQTVMAAEEEGSKKTSSDMKTMQM